MSTIGRVMVAGVLSLWLGVAAGCASKGAGSGGGQSCCTETKVAGGGGAGGAATPQALHRAYGEAINANDLDAIMALVSEDVVFLPPGDVRTSGKAAVRPWIEGYFKAYTTHWETKVVKFEVSGDWAFVEEIYDSTDTPKLGTPGNVVKDHGKGLDVLHREKDGMWRVVYDVWNSAGAAGK